MDPEAEPVEITPFQFECQVKAWLEHTAGPLEGFTASQRSCIGGDSGEYEIDIEARFQAFGGAEFVVLVECKRYKHPVKRDVVMLLESKIRDTGAHKGMIFSTSSFQRGALEYAKARGIATLIVQDGRTNYHTKAYRQKVEPPPWVHVSKYIAWFAAPGGPQSVVHSLVDDTRIDPIMAWLKGMSDA
jgi:restriction system protein